ncbi:efflux RND transporter periplasmic adaptor subunit [Colwellia sp. 4_MG-2023]|uniref:efflux RND transporter periplasmic adaptor subunit n=1 Tax=unclassified Colwellia TaxID=196834 RepID=UPI001C08092C|nr:MULTISPECIES: efflux RND transporter periplasmic adaptor subunit [unclassified Colwellia]MBU2924076.1 efflux RND transporter periplasmic adaptor subunit [Colwellia sp. C2M11]MDO6506109.1 efflux RND transporter periplasmic adaptor subunit [Colwellia sp. 5_MG-2023]MDO6554831.1 efflux RND transporter periplasmic adaptor subunit [Colwellia sp. 4_MG-2023]MDO6651966.1 efflux RND transporter periplasmic adaptor subunit [Colwellia sp. 3_MG-2023]MDO6664742.1 efflux RND transporter periplasmic adapto
MARKKQIIIPIAILAIGIGAYIGFSSMKKPPEEKAEVDNTPIVEVKNITVMPMTMKVSSYGVVKPKYETTIVAQVSGEVVELSDTFVRGGLVKKGQLLARIDPNDYHAALIDAQANMASARAALETEVAQGKVAEKEWQQITDTSPTELSLRKPQLAQELANVKSAQAAILRAERNLQRTEIRAPYDAMINSRSIGLGSFVGVGSEIGMLLGTAIAEVRLPVADNQLQYLIDQGLQSTVNLSGTFAGEEIQWQAKIVRSEGVVDDNSRMTYLVAEIQDPYYLNHSNKEHDLPLRFGSYVTAKILGINIEHASIVPQYLVVNEQVALLDSESKLHYADVNIVRQEGGDVVINKGLLDGDQLIVSSLDYPVEGMKLSLVTDIQEKTNDNSSTSPEKIDVVNNENEGE